MSQSQDLPSQGRHTTVMVFSLNVNESEHVRYTVNVHISTKQYHLKAGNVLYSALLDTQLLLL